MKESNCDHHFIHYKVSFHHYRSHAYEYIPVDPDYMYMYSEAIAATKKGPSHRLIEMQENVSYATSSRKMQDHESE